MLIAPEAAAVADDSQQFWGPMAATAMLLGVLAYVIFFLAALVSILGADQTGGMKLVWIIFAFTAPFLGPLLWFVVGRRQSGRQRTDLSSGRP